MKRILWCGWIMLPMLAACGPGGGERSAPVEVEDTPRASRPTRVETPAATATTRMEEPGVTEQAMKNEFGDGTLPGAAGRDDLTYEQLKPRAAENVTIDREIDYEASRTEVPAYLRLFGRPHEDLKYLTLTIDGQQGNLSFFRFGSAAEARAALAKAKEQYVPRFPREFMQVGPFVIVAQMADNSAETLARFAAAARGLIEARVGAVESAIDRDEPQVQ